MQEEIKLCPACGMPLHKVRQAEYNCPFCRNSFVLEGYRLVLKSQSHQTPSEYEKKAAEQRRSTAIKLVVTCAVFIIIVIGGIFAASFANSFSKKPTTNNNNNVATPTTSSKEGFRSEYYKDFVRQVFKKNYDQVTAAELSEITHFTVHSDNKYIVDYRRSNGELQTVVIKSQASRNNQDLTMFPNLRVLDASLSESDKAIFKSFVLLEELSITFSPDVIADLLPNPEQLTKLTTKFSKGTLDKIDVFRNLKELSLTISSSSITSTGTPIDLDKIGNLKYLDKLYFSGEGYFALPFLEKLRNLSTLIIHDKDLRDLSCLSSINSLTSLSLDKCSILNIDFLSDLNLTTLRLNNCSKIESYLPIEKMASLEVLEFENRSGAAYPESYKALKNVWKLKISSFYDIAFLSDFTNVTDLTLSGCSATHLSAITGMKNLNRLSFINGYNYPYLDFLTGFDRLTEIDVKFSSSQDSHYFGLEHLFLVPNIKRLSLDGVSFALDLNALKTNTSLEVLRLNQVKFKQCSQDPKKIPDPDTRTYPYKDWTAVPMNDARDIFRLYPNLTELHLMSDEISTLDFATDLKNLKLLDIRNNYITDLSPLKGSTKLTKVYCGENPLSKLIELSNGELDTTTKSTRINSFSSLEW